MDKYDQDLVFSLSDISALLLGGIVFIILIGLDIRKALKKGAHWVPGHALVLTALTIQLMNFVEVQTGSLQSLALRQGWDYNFFIMIHASRVMLCVLMALILPAMARPGHEEKWTKIAALGFSVFLDIFSGFLFEFLNPPHPVESHAVKHFAESYAPLFELRNPPDSFESHVLVSSKSYAPPKVRPLFMVSSVIISISMVWLIQLLISSAIASKSIRNITAQRIPLILEHPAQNSWKAVEDHVLRSWIVFLACYPESIVARSVLASSAALALTFCILTSLVGWIALIVRKKLFTGVYEVILLLSPELIFILIGWAVVSWRYLTSLAYYPTSKMDTWGKYLSVEPIWTSHFEKLLQKKEESHLLKPSEVQKINKIIANEETEICNLQKGLFKCMIYLQKIVVVFCKGCWLLAEVTFSNRLLRRIASLIFSNHIKKVDKDFEEHKAILERVHILGATPRSVFATNRKSIKRARELMIKGYNDGRKCVTVNKFLEQKMSSEHVGKQCLDPENTQTGCTQCLNPGSSRTGLNFVCKLGPCPALGVEKYFMYMKKQSWKLTAVSLINIIFRLCPESGESALKAYSEAMELMGLVENSDPEADRIFSKAADRLLKPLSSRQNSSNKITTMDEAAEEIKKLAEDAAKSIKKLVEKRDKELAEQMKKEYGMICNVQDTAVEWENIVAGNALYKLCMSIDCRSGEFTELMKELESSLADIIGDCIKKVGVALVDNCIKWAQDLEERKLLEAVYIAGKSKGLMELLKWDPNLQIAPTTEKTSAKVPDPTTEKTCKSPQLRRKLQ